MESYQELRGTLRSFAKDSSRKFIFQYIDDVGLEGVFENYSYHGNDLSIVAPYLQYWWRFAVEYLPLTLAPNMVTLIGLLFILLSYLVSLYFDPHLKGEGPSWIFLFHAFCMFMYQTLDALDGKQARRTGNSTPLGELFDHGCDAITTSLTTLTVYSSTAVGTSWPLTCAMLLTLTLFYFAQWEEYQRGVLELGYVNVTEAQILVMSLHMISFFFGSSVWLKALTIGSFSIALNMLPFCALIGSFVGTAYVNFRNVVVEIQTRKLNPISVYGQLVPILICDFCLIVWVISTDVVQTHSHQAFLCFGMIMANLVGKVVFARVCTMQFSTFQPITLIMVFIACNAYFKGPLASGTLANVGCVLSILSYLHLASYVIFVLCNDLGIYAFSIIPRVQKT